jgi:CRISPR-associated protein Csd2
MTAPYLNPAVRHDAVLLFDVTDGNPNGDPDAGNQPRQDGETGQGLVSDVAIKRKIRNTVPLVKEGDERFGIFVEAGTALNTRIDGALDETAPAKGKRDPAAAQRLLCERYFDIRMFGAVMSTGEKVGNQRGAGHVYGPVQVSFARTIEEIAPIEHTITRVTPTKPADLENGKVSEMGRKWTVPYGLYRGTLHYSAAKGAKTGVQAEDLEVLWRSIEYMFEHDRSSARGEMKLCGLVVFSHTSALGNAPAHALAQRVRIERTEVLDGKPARELTDYRMRFDLENLPAGVEASVLVDLWTAS